MRTFLWQARGRENRGQLLKLPVQMKLLETTLLAATGNNSIYLIDPGGRDEQSDLRVDSPYRGH